LQCNKKTKSDISNFISSILIKSFYYEAAEKEPIEKDATAEKTSSGQKRQIAGPNAGSRPLSSPQDPTDTNSKIQKLNRHFSDASNDSSGSVSGKPASPTPPIAHKSTTSLGGKSRDGMAKIYDSSSSQHQTEPLSAAEEEAYKSRHGERSRRRSSSKERAELAVAASLLASKNSALKESLDGPSLSVVVRSRNSGSNTSLNQNITRMTKRHALIECGNVTDDSESKNESSSQSSLLLLSSPNNASSSVSASSSAGSPQVYAKTETRRKPCGQVSPVSSPASPEWKRVVLKKSQDR
jgi:hypothetical protein